MKEADELFKLSVCANIKSGLSSSSLVPSLFLKEGEKCLCHRDGTSLVFLFGQFIYFQPANALLHWF